MSIHFKAAVLALGVASLFSAGQANAAGCDGSVQQMRSGRTVQCYYLPTVTNGRISGEQKVVNYGGTFSNPYGGQYENHPGAIIGGGAYPPIRRPH
jgi:hypothetical protein